MKNIDFVTIREAEKFAKRKTRKQIFDWLQSGSEDNSTSNKNIIDLNNLRLKPLHLRKVGKIDLSTNFFGKKISSPLILSPMGHQTQFHKKGEIETAKGVDIVNTVSFFSTQGRMSLKDIRKNNINSKLCWTIFPFGNKNWIKKEIKDAEGNKCKAIALCIDANVRSHRYMDREARYDSRKVGSRTNPVPPNQLAALDYDWDLVKFMKSKTKLPLIIKGILSYEDANKCIKLGVDGIWISNHGGRMFNSGISGVESLIEIKKKISKKKQKMKILVDGGVRKGSDILKFLCIGADYVGIGRPAMYGLILKGHNGVKEIFDILNNELRTSMQNGGFKSFKECVASRILY